MSIILVESLDRLSREANFNDVDYQLAAADNTFGPTYTASVDR